MRAWYRSVAIDRTAGWPVEGLGQDQKPEAPRYATGQGVVLVKPGRDIDGIAKTEADHHMKCPGCGRWFDMRDLKQVAEHIHDGDFEVIEEA